MSGPACFLIKWALRNSVPGRPRGVCVHFLSRSANMNSTTRNCWNSGKCYSPLEQCFVHFKTAAAGQALCRETCPKDWLWRPESRMAVGLFVTITNDWSSN